MKFFLSLTWLAALALALPTPSDLSLRCISSTDATCDKRAVVVEVPKEQEKKRCISSTAESAATCD
jgi:hypothetical protein